jgi:hypothetical protein
VSTALSPDEWADGERADASLFTLSSLDREQLRQRQQHIEGEMEALETCTEQEFGKNTEEMQARMRALSLEWGAIEQEWVRRAALTGGAAMADLATGWLLE